MAGEHAVAVVVERGEAVDPGPHIGLRGVEQMRAVAVVLDAGLRVLLGKRVAAEMRPASPAPGRVRIEHGRDALGHNGAEEAAADDDVAILAGGDHVAASASVRGCRRCVGRRLAQRCALALAAKLEARTPSIAPQAPGGGACDDTRLVRVQVAGQPYMIFVHDWR